MILKTRKVSSQYFMKTLLKAILCSKVYFVLNPLLFYSIISLRTAQGTYIPLLDCLKNDSTILFFVSLILLFVSGIFMIKS